MTFLDLHFLLVSLHLFIHNYCTSGEVEPQVYTACHKAKPVKPDLPYCSAD
jgi:hypothetical protein